MNVIGIIAEYNPFHRGHEYQIQTLRERCGADYVVIAMSGNFVQRGAPALMDKFTRTKMALSCGADLVLELPALFATASAEYFAKGGVSLLQDTGVVTHLGFGAETDDLELLSSLADVLAEEPAFYQECLRRELKTGISFPAARSKALKHCFPEIPKIEHTLASPNNILALEYLKSIKSMRSPLIPIAIKRRGKGYHDTELSDTKDQEVFCSASAIRSCLRNIPSCEASSHKKKKSHLQHSCAEGFLALKTVMPKASYDILTQYPHPLLFEDDLSALLHYELLTDDANCLAFWADSSPELAHRLLSEREHFTDWSSFCEHMKTKNFTYTRLSRLFTHMLLHIRQEDYQLFSVPSYLRILGFRKSAAPLLSSLKKSSSLPIVTSMAEAGSLLTEKGFRLLEYDLRAASLYRLCLISKGDYSMPNAYRQQIVRL